jgi:AcrR family transcriptional regulator
MTITTKRQRVIKSPQDRRRDIMDAAVKVFSHKGIAEATIADVTRVAGVAKGTFYLYFESREQLLAALRERFMQDMLDHAAPFMERVGTEDWWALADDVVASIIDFTLQHSDTISLFMQGPRTPEVLDILAKCERMPIEMMAEGIRAGVDAGVFHVSDPEMAASFLFHALDGAALGAILYGGKPDRDRMVRVGREIFRKMLSP